MKSVRDTLCTVKKFTPSAESCTILFVLSSLSRTPHHRADDT
jgi:hypothetical protein